jgi:CheY-like chemotaxis protein
LKKERIDLAEFIHKEAASLHSTIAGRRQELLLRLPPESVQFMADRMRLEQIVVNVLTNASKYTGPGGTIEFSGAREGSEVVVHCKDTGQGILPEYKEKIFEPFIRGRNKNDSPGEASLGIGLALAKQLTELHGGTISVESAGEGMGSDFMIRLPLVAPPSERNISVEGKPVGPASRGLSIVFVEDNSDIAQLMGFALKQVGHSVHIFADGSSALARIADLRPNVVLLDIGLPGMDGYELAAEMKRVANMRNTMFIALSGFKRRELDQKDQGHFDHYFTKPVDVRALLNLLDESSRPLRILLVEDHADLAAATQAILRDEGYDVQTAMTGRAALQMAQNFRPQLILCDMNLPDMHGLEVIRALRSDPPTVDMHAVVLAAMSETEIRAYESKAGEFGVDAFMSKPIRPDAVRKLVSKLSATRRS